ncbi:MAG: 5-bromo-4-chloroindolyl phosphate hydrolysis family protein [Paracoccaceae bacterium]
MAKRFGGKFSPDGESAPVDQVQERGAYEGARRDAAGMRANVLFVPAIPMVFMSLNDGAVGLALALVAAATLTLAAWMTREGLRAEAEYNARKVARRPVLPRKLVGSGLTGIGIALAAYKTGMADGTGGALLAGLLFGAITAGVHVASFGLDPMKNKGMEGIDTHQQDRVARVVDEAEKTLREMSDAILRAGDRKMESRVERFQTTARELFRTVEDDPRDLSGARKYMTVYLRGARDATAKFADVYSRTRDAGAREDYAALLDDLEQNFAARTRKMLLDDRSDLTVEIEVLRDRLSREGVKLD